MTITRIVTIALISALPSIAFAQDAMKGMDMGAGPADAGYLKAMQDMHRAMMDMKPSKDADRDFVTMMIPHHQGAIDMAKVELQYGKDKKLRALAKTIIVAQQKEIGEMKAWLAHH